MKYLSEKASSSFQISSSNVKITNYKIGLSHKRSSPAVVTIAIIIDHFLVIAVSQSQCLCSSLCQKIFFSFIPLFFSVQLGCFSTHF